MSTIKLKCVDQVLAFTNTPVITTGDQNIDNMKIDFCPLWDGFVRVGIFFQQKGVFSYAVINADGSCPIPNSILKLEGKIYFAVSGTNSKNQVRTSNIVCYTIEEGVADAHIQDEFPEDITEEEKNDIYYKMLELVTEMQTLTQDLIQNFAYVRIKDGNEFSYGVDQLQAQIRAYTYEKASIDQKISALNALIGSTGGDLSATNIAVANNTANIADLSSKIATNTSSISTLTTGLDQTSEKLDSSLIELTNNIANVYNTANNAVKSEDYQIDKANLQLILTEIETRLAKLED